MLAALLAMLLAGLPAGMVRGSTVVPPRHLGALADMSEAVVLATAGSSSVFVRGNQIFTRTRFDVLEVIRGAVQRRAQISVETYGGRGGDVVWMVAGSPQFSEGTVYLLFLSRRDAAWQPRMLAYGLMEQAVAPDGSMLLSHVQEHHDLALLRRPDGVEPEPVGTYYAQPLLRHLRQVVTARAAWDRALVEVPEALRPPAHASASKAGVFPEPCAYFTYGGYPIRWNAFDNDVTVSIYAEAGGDRDVSGDAAFFAVQQSIEAWTAIPGVAIGYHWGGVDAYTPDCSDGSASPEDLAADQGLVQYNDPCNELPDLTDCIGPLAYGGSLFQTGATGRHRHRDMDWNTSAVALVTVNNGVGACVSYTEYRIMMTHELGHTLGLAHIPVERGRAIMNPDCCTDITEIDQTCALFSYSNQFFALPPGEITLEDPADNADDRPMTLSLSWRAAATADTYELQVSINSSFSQVVFEDKAVTGATREVGPLQGATRHYWRVRGVNAYGTGPWSSTFRFTTQQVIPGAVALRSPVDGAVDVPAEVELQWREAAATEKYQLQVSVTKGFSELAVEDAGLTETRRTVGPLANGTPYYWRVRGTNATGQGTWSPTWRFTTVLVAPGAVALKAPDEDALGLPGIVTFAWQADATADVYHLQVSTAEDFSAMVFEADALTQTTQDAGPLAYSTTHYWRVRGINAAGVGSWSPVRRFTVAVGTAVARLGEEIPGVYRLYRNYPNPFNPSTTLRFDLPLPAEVTLAVYDVLGRTVETLASGALPAGRYTFTWEAGDRPSGLYLVRLQAGSFSQAQEMLLLK